MRRPEPPYRRAKGDSVRRPTNGEYSWRKGMSKQPLGKNQLATLRALGPHLVCIVGSKEHRSLQKRGLVESLGDDGNSFFAITPDGLRSLADAIDSGKLHRWTIDDFKPKPPAHSKGAR